MSKYKICVYAICKNEVSFVEKWMDSMDEADLVVVTDTGSTDGTPDKLQKRGAIVYTTEVKPWRFDVARNISLDNVPKDVDICVCTDLDEVFNPGWREKLETAWGNHKPRHKGPIAKSGKYLYNRSLKPDGTPGIQINYFKVHERHGFRWKCPVHEYIKYEGNKPVEKVYIEGMVLNHYPDNSKSRSSYLTLLEFAVKEEPDDDRMRYYLGREYMYKGEWQKCIDTLKSYLDMPSATWNEERCAAMRWIANCYWKLDLIKDAYSWFYRAIAEAPHMREPYVEFSKMCYKLKDWPMTFFLSENALRIKQKTKTYVNMGYAWDFTPNDLCAISAYHLNLLDKSYEHARAALSYAPDNERLKNNLKIIESAKND
ncbi:tetratricopeptide repeat-containing glycosyltransferase [Sporosalibacterium faouarense]|uniref:tetratricopeptide repeat-containing glycosyltransferase n=1 Tax=Sporosalibacterium faouarense TaxID=516123 RepID=UPI00192AC75A|nr:glycosyltransferase [Sporosalibacterium faouarense]